MKTLEKISVSNCISISGPQRLKIMIARRKFCSVEVVISENEAYFKAEDKAYYENGIEKFYSMTPIIATSSLKGTILNNKNKLYLKKRSVLASNFSHHLLVDSIFILKIENITGIYSSLCINRKNERNKQSVYIGIGNISCN